MFAKQMARLHQRIEYLTNVIDENGISLPDE
jgi:hypothetical protein